MTKDITYAEELDTVIITYSGPVPLTAVQEAIQIAYDMAVEHQCKRFLVDCLKMKPGGGSTLDIYELARMFEQFPDMCSYKDAILLPPIPESVEDLKFFETTARNRGFNVRVFSDRQAAIDWLME